MTVRAPTPDVQMTMAEAFRAAAAPRIEREALICDPLEASGSTEAVVRLTYGDLLQGIDALNHGDVGVRSLQEHAERLTAARD